MTNKIISQQIEKEVGSPTSFLKFKNQLPNPCTALHTHSLYT